MVLILAKLDCYIDCNNKKITNSTPSFASPKRRIFWFLYELYTKIKSKSVFQLFECFNLESAFKKTQRYCQVYQSSDFDTVKRDRITSQL